MTPDRRRHHVGSVAAPGKIPKPFPRIGGKSRFDRERGIRFQHRTQRIPNSSGSRERQHMAWGNVTTIAVRASGSKSIAVDNRDLAARFNKIPGAHRTNHATTNHDDGLGLFAHVRIPMQNGSDGSRIKVASPEICARPRIVGMTVPFSPGS